MRRLFIIRKDLHLTGGKLAAMVGHCCEAYWTWLLRRGCEEHPVVNTDVKRNIFTFTVDVDIDVWKKYCLGIFTKTICECANKNQLMKAVTMAKELGLAEYQDYGLINDKCLTELKPENPDGSTTVGIWFRPLNDDIAHQISKKFKLYRDSSKVKILTCTDTKGDFIRQVKIVNNDYIPVLKTIFSEIKIDPEDDNVFKKMQNNLINNQITLIDDKWMFFSKEVEV